MTRSYTNKVVFLGFCGNSIENGGRLLTPTSTPTNGTCNMRCRGNGPQICGGNNALSLYNNTGYIAPKHKSPIGKYVVQGCLSDPNNGGRSLQGASTTNSRMTEDMCVKYCLGRRYQYAG